MRRLAFLAAATVVVATFSWAEEAAKPTAASHYEQVLLEKRIDPTERGLLAYFRSLHPDEAYRQRVAQLIRDLGSSESFVKREQAMSQLVVLPQPPREALATAAAGDDPEVRWRAKQILQTATTESDRVLYAALRVIEEKKPAGLTEELVRAVPLCDKPHLIYAVGEAMRASARASDAAPLREALKSKNLEVRVAAAGALGKALGAKAADDLHGLASDPQDKVKVAAARALANTGDRRSLQALVALLSSDEINVRVMSAVTLRALTDKDFGYAAYDVPSKRDAAIAKWKTWVGSDGKTAKLNLPLKPLGAGVSYLNGNTLLAYGYMNKVIEYDPGDREVWSYDAPGAWSAEKLANGNVLIAVYNGGKVVQVDPAKKEVWDYACSSPLNAKALPNGNILIAEYGGGKLTEVAPDKKVVWTHTCGGSPTDVHRLDNGNTLFSVNSSGCREVTPEGKTVWEYTGGNIYGCQPLPSGNVLIADLNGQVIEVTRDKKVVWQYAGQSPVDCFRLPNGNTLITEHSRFIEVTPDKKIVWEKSGCSYGSARR
jgi:hypothetical protein